MIVMSMMGGVGVRVEVGRKELSSKELGSELTVGVFAEYGTGDSDIQKLSFSRLCPCEKKSEGKSNYVGGGLLGRYNIYEDEFSGTKEQSSGLSPKIYGEAILRAGQVGNSFKIKEVKKNINMTTRMRCMEDVH